MYRVYRLTEKEQDKIVRMRFDGDTHYYDVFDSQEERDEEERRLAEIHKRAEEEKLAYYESLKKEPL